MYLHVSLHACIHTYVRTYKRIVVSCVEGMWLPQPSISHWIWPFKALTNDLVWHTAHDVQDHTQGSEMVHFDPLESGTGLE